MVAKKRNKQIDVILSLVILLAIFSIIFYIWNIINNPHQSEKGYTATITLVWRNVPKELANNIRVNDPIFVGSKPSYIVVKKWTEPYLISVPTPQSATVVESQDTFNIYLQIRNLTPLSSTTPPIGKNLAILGNTAHIESYIWQFDGIVVNVNTATFSPISHDYLPQPETRGCEYKIIARNVYPSVISHIKTNEPLFDVLGRKILILKNVKISHPLIYGWTPKGIVAQGDPTKSDIILTVSPIKGNIPISINGKPAKVGRALEIRGTDWRIWGRIIEVTCP